MIEILAGGLQARDEFTIDDGTTWYQINQVHLVPRQKKVVIITSVGKEFIFKDDMLIVTR